jgi:hypothetical protein
VQAEYLQPYLISTRLCIYLTLTFEVEASRDKVGMEIEVGMERDGIGWRQRVGMERDEVEWLWDRMEAEA